MLAAFMTFGVLALILGIVCGVVGCAIFFDNRHA